MSEEQRLTQQLESAFQLSQVVSWTWELATDELAYDFEDHTLFTPRTGAEFYASIDHDGKQRYVDAMAETLEHGSVFDYEVGCRVEGEVVWFKGRGRLERDEEGRVLRIHGVSQDVTRLREAEAALRDEVRIAGVTRAITAAANVATDVADALRTTTPVIAGSGFWRSATAYVSDPDGGLLPLDSAPTDPREDSTAAAACRSGQPEWSPDRDVLAVPVMVSDRCAGALAMTQSEPGHAPASLAVAETIASQLQLVGARAEIAQSLAIARDEAITARAQKSQSLTRMSHEVLTPLNGLLGLNDLLAKTDLDREQRRLLSAQAVAGRELLSLVNDVLDFDNILEHGLRLDPSPFELDELLERARERCQTYLGEKPVTCTFVTDADVPLELVGDRARLLQLLDVLLSNAAKFTHSGEIAVHVSLAAGDPEATGRLRLDFTVRDTGIGIPETIAPGLFERFTQADTTTARSFGGAGLGLAIAREITDAMHGQLALTHVAEGGSEFSAVVELAVSDVAVAPIDGYAKRALAGRRVLIVEPDAGTLHRLKGLGHRWDLDVVAVPDPGAGWTALSEATDSGEPFAAAIIGLGRPGTAGPVGDDPGLGFAERIATDSTYDAVTMILISSGQVNLAEIRSLGVSVVLNHPVTTRALRGTLLEQVAGVSAEPSPEAESRAGRRNQRILIVEDNPVNQLVASGLLEANGFETVVASGGTEALTTLDDERVNAVLMDVQMPGMDGYETTRAIRGRPDAAARLPIIALTAAAVDGERQRCLSAGMDDYLAKPVEVESLVACLERWIGPAVAPPPAPTRTPTPPIDGLDTTRLDVLRDLDADNTDYLDRAIGNFASNSASGLATLEDLITQGSYDLVAAEAHKLVGSAFNLGVPRAGYAARAIEEAAREDRDGEIPDLLPELRDALVEGRRLLSQYQSTYAS